MYIVKSLLDKYWDFSIPIDLNAIINDLNISIVYDDLKHKDGYLDNKNKTIYINSNYPVEFNRFVLARELGHFCLNHALITLKPANISAYTPYDTEEAIQFAIELLMPAVAIKAMIDTRGEKDPVVLRKAFGVTSSLLYARLSQLHYFI